MAKRQDGQSERGETWVARLIIITRWTLSTENVALRFKICTKTVSGQTSVSQRASFPACVCVCVCVCLSHQHGKTTLNNVSNRKLWNECRDTAKLLVYFARKTSDLHWICVRRFNNKHQPCKRTPVKTMCRFKSVSSESHPLGPFEFEKLQQTVNKSEMPWKTCSGT